MEAKGCAKPVVWKNSRRHFYWATRARIAQSSALAHLVRAAPDTSLDHRSRLLYSLAGIEPTADYRRAAEVLEKLDISQTLAQLKADRLLRQFKQLTKDDRNAALDGFTRLVEDFSKEERAALLTVLNPSESLTKDPVKILTDCTRKVLDLIITTQ
jgi:acetyl-CoA carboxylase/biotin carboxylase 1